MSLKDTPFADVQRIVLKGGAWGVALHLVLRFDPQRSAPLRFLGLLRERLGEDEVPTALAHPHGSSYPPMQLSLGFTRRGLEHAGVPRHVLLAFASYAPAFHAGAAPRATRCGIADAERWDAAYAFGDVDAVLSLHGKHPDELAPRLRVIEEAAVETGVCVRPLPVAQGHGVHGNTQRVFFGFRDGVSRVGIRGVSTDHYLGDCDPDSIHEPGEFLLGQPQNSGANPWVSAAMQQLWPEELRAFFHNGSFGVLQQIEQHVDAFKGYVEAAAAASGDRFKPDEIAAKLCGRTLDGHPVGRPELKPMADFDYKDDEGGLKCPYGSHARRMNPRGGKLAQTRRRPLLRRGMSYENGEERGLLAHFFCASIEDQYEFLFGEWIDRVPLGSPDPGGARDPLMGQHQPGDGPFVIPLEDGTLLKLPPLPRMVRTRGSAYLFYPSATALGALIAGLPFLDLSEYGR